MIKAEYETLEDVPERYRDLFSEQGGKFRLTQIDGMKTDADVSRVSRALEKERAETKEYKETLAKKLGGRSVDDLLAEYNELAQGTENEKQNMSLKMDREKERLKKELDRAMGQIQEFQGREKTRAITDSVRDAALKAKVTSTALEDVLLLSERVFDVDPHGGVVTKDDNALSPDEWLKIMETARPHWWPSSSGGGSMGSAATGSKPVSGNPWKTGNLTEQMQLYKADPDLAAKLRKEAE